MLGISQKPVALNAANIDTLVFESENVFKLFITCESNLPPCLLPPPRPPLSPDEEEVSAVYCPLLLGHSRCTRTAKARVSAPRVKAAMKRSRHIGASWGDTTAARGTDENHTWTNWGVAVGSNCFFLLYGFTFPLLITATNNIVANAANVCRQMLGFATLHICCRLPLPTSFVFSPATPPRSALGSVPSPGRSPSRPCPSGRGRRRLWRPGGGRGQACPAPCRTRRCRRRGRSRSGGDKSE